MYKVPNFDFQFVICTQRFQFHGIFLHLLVLGESGYLIYFFIYGVLNGGFHYVFKMYIYDISRSRNFIRTWPLIQSMQGLGALIGIPMSNDILNGSCLLLAALSLILGDRFHAHLKELKKHEEHLRVRYGKKISEICIGNIFFFFLEVSPKSRSELSFNYHP